MIKERMNGLRYVIVDARLIHNSRFNLEISTIV